MKRKELVTQSQFNHLLEAEAQMAESPDTPYTSPFLKLLMSANREQLSNSFKERHCEPGEIVFREDDPGDTMYLIWSGRVAIVKGNLETPTILSYRGAGEIIGEMALLENQPRSATIIALDQLRLLGINQQRFTRLIQEIPSLSLGIMEMLSARLRKTDELRQTGEISERRLKSEVTHLQYEKRRLEELRQLQQETSELIIHDLRNPLSSIGVALKMLSVMLPEETLRANQEILDIAKESCERLQRLVDTLLEVARMESGETKFIWTEFDLPALVTQTVDQMTLLQKKGIKLITQFQPGLPQINADRDKIERVLMNLLDNALKYSPEQGQVTIGIEKMGDNIRVKVVDSGPGVPEADRQRIFERFTQGMYSLPNRRGFGLGLAYCRSAIEGHGGQIGVEAVDSGKGSEFFFTLPISPNVSTPKPRP